jgi:hypothetical protein
MSRRHDDGQVGGDHYSRMDVTPWEFLASCLTPEEFRGYLKGEAIVYLARERAKGGPVDVGKARHTLQRLEALDAALAPPAPITLFPLAPEVKAACTACAGQPCRRMGNCPYEGAQPPSGLQAPQTRSSRG